MSEHEYKISEKVVCTSDSEYGAYKDSIYTITDIFNHSTGVHFRLKEQSKSGYWQHIKHFKPYVSVKISPRVIHFLKEYKDKGHITRTEWLELKTLIEELEK